jgi:cation:H+ antiporter
VDEGGWLLFLGPILLFLVGIVLLWFGAEWLVKGAAALGRSLGVSSLVIGFTIVACATSMPEQLVSLVAAYRGSTGLALGNVVGSNIANIGLVLGVSSLLAPIVLRAGLHRREVPMMIGLSTIFLLFAWQARSIGRLEGGILLLLLVLLLWWMVWTARREGVPDGEGEEIPALPWPRAALFATVGLVVLLAGAELMIRSGVRMAELLSVPEEIIGLSMVAIGTSLPELAASVVSALRRNPELAFGNVVGSNLFNISFVAGTVSVVRPIDVADRIARLDMPVMLGFSVALYLLMLRRPRIGRREGGLLLAGYVLFILHLALVP